MLDDRTRLLGESHQETWSARNNLAGAHFAVGDFDRAYVLFAQNLRISDTSTDHQDRVLTRHNRVMARFYVDEAAQLIRIFDIVWIG